MFKKLMEQRAKLMEQMEELTQNAELETRAFNEDEEKSFDDLKNQIEAIDRTLANLEQQRALTNVVEAKEEPGEPEQKETVEEMEIRAFASIIRQKNDPKLRANMTYTDNTAVIPKTIINKIIDRVKDISPLFGMAERYSIKGTVSIPYVDSANDNIAVAYATEFTDLTSVASKLLSIDLNGYLAGVLTKVSKSLLNSTDIDLVNFVINKMSTAVAVFMDTEILQGTSGKITGLSNASQIKTAASASAITVNELIALQDMLKSAYQSGAIWVMKPATFTTVKQLLAGTSNYELNNSIENGFSGRLLGKPVYVTDQADGIATAKKPIYYINPSQALAVKVVEDSVQVLNEVYAAQHALGVVTWIEADAKIQNQQAVAVLQMA